MSKDPPRRSLLNRVARRVSRIRKRAEQSISALQQEASHPGRPQPHMVGRNEFWQSDDDRKAAAATPSATYRPGGDPSVDPHARPDNDGAAGDDAWYLRGDDEGWSDTNPTDDEST